MVGSHLALNTELSKEYDFLSDTILDYFFPPIESAGFPASEFAVAATFTFSFFGFLVSFLLFLPLAIVCPFKMQRFNTKMA